MYVKRNQDNNEKHSVLTGHVTFQVGHDNKGETT